MKWLGASGAIVAGLILAGVGTRFELNGGVATMDSVPWGLVLLVALMVSLALAGISLFRAPSACLANTTRYARASLPHMDQ